MFQYLYIITYSWTAYKAIIHQNQHAAKKIREFAEPGFRALILYILTYSLN